MGHGKFSCQMSIGKASPVGIDPFHKPFII